MVKYSFKISKVIFIFIVLVLILTNSTNANSKILNIKPFLEVKIGNKSIEMLGLDTDEGQITDYDKFYFPASMISSENEGKIYVLDSIKNRICVYDINGKGFLNEIKLPFNYHPIDFTYLPNFNRFFIVFQDTSTLGIIDVLNEKNNLKITSHKLIDLKNYLSDDILIQNIWVLNIKNNNEENYVLLNTAFNEFKNIILSFNAKNNKITVNKNLKANEFNQYAYSGMSDFITWLELSTSESKLIKEYLNNSNELDWFNLLKELTLGKSGFNCRNLRIIGIDSNENIYIEAHYGIGEDRIENTYIYKFNKNGRFKGRVEIFSSPEMLVNRFIYVDAAGTIYYMKKDMNNNKIQFYKFVINELN